MQSGAPFSNNLTSNRVLAQNTLWNLIGQGVPLLVAVFAIPVLVKGMGVDRFGILALAWMMIGYFSLFDFGLGRAMIKLVAEKLGTDREHEVSALVWTGLFLMLLLGIVGSMVLGLLSPWLAKDILKIPKALQVETLRAFYLIALSIPVVIITTGLRGVLEAHQRFGFIITVSIPLGIFTFLGPLLALPFSNDLFTVIAVLMVGRLIACLSYVTLCLRAAPSLCHNIMLQHAMIRPLLSFGSWMTVTNIVGPLMDYLDRFFIGALLSVAAVAYYATPYDIVTRLWIIPVALTGVLFPAFASTLEADRARVAHLFSRSVKYVFLALFPVMLIIITFAQEGLDLWLGAEFARNSTRVLQLLAVGVFINSLARVPFALVQAAGRPDLTAKLHIIELPFYLLTIWWLIARAGIEGAAIAWVARVAVDAILLFTMARRFLPPCAATFWQMSFVIAATLFALACAFVPVGLSAKVGFTFVVLFVFAVAALRLALAPDELALIRNYFKNVRINQ